MLPIAYILLVFAPGRLLLLLLGWRLPRLCQVSLPYMIEFKAFIFAIFDDHFLHTEYVLVLPVLAATLNKSSAGGPCYILGGHPCFSQSCWGRHLPRISSAIQPKMGPIATAIYLV